MLRLCLLQYIYGDSDREVEENARDKLAYKYFLGLAVDEEPPDFTTVSYFRAVRLGEEKFRQVFENIVQQCIEKGLVKGKRQIVDSTHIVADIAMNSLTGILKLCRRNVLKTIENQDAALAGKLGIEDLKVVKQYRFIPVEEGLEKEIGEAENLLDGVTKELRDGKLEATLELQRHLELLEKAVADREEGAKDRLVSPVDPDARGGKKTGKSWAGYKAHLVVEEDSEIITSVETTPANKADGSQLKPLLKRQETAHSIVPEELSADKAYDSAENLEMLDSKGITGNISLTRKVNYFGADFFTVDDFTYDADREILTCPAGCVAGHRRRAVFRGKDSDKKGTVFQFRPEQCNACELKARCHTVAR
jgi:IS5 family transposase